jgi:hypothetical protein
MERANTHPPPHACTHISHVSVREASALLAAGAQLEAEAQLEASQRPQNPPHPLPPAAGFIRAQSLRAGDTLMICADAGRLVRAGGVGGQ